MTRQEFLDELRLALNGEVAPSVITDNLAYYERFILEEVRKGRTEEEVLEELGSPRLIARTIIDTSGNMRSQRAYEEYQGYEDADQDINININGRSYHQKRRKMRVIAWAAVLIVIAVAIALLALVGSVISLLAPVLLPVLLILILIGVLSGKK